MEPTTTTQPTHETNGQRAEVTGIVEQLSALTRDEKRDVLRALLRDMLGTAPKGEWCVCNEDDTCFLYLMSPGRRSELTVTPERIAQWRAELATAKLIPFRDVINWMEEQLANEQK